MATDTRVPTSDYSIQWSRSTGSDNYATVDEYPSTNDADYNYQSGGVKTDLFGFTAFEVPAGSVINSVTVYLRGKTATASNLGQIIRVGETDYFGWVSDWGTSFNEKTKVWETNPKTTSAWTVDDVNGVGGNALQYFGYLGNTGSGEQDVSRVYIEVDYDEAIPSASESVSQSPSKSPSESGSQSPSASPSESFSESPSLSPSASESPSSSPSMSASESFSVSPSESFSSSPSLSPSASMSPSGSPS